MGGDGAMANVTHVILDEVHERDQFSDLLLTVLKDILPKQKHIKIIMMSATVDTTVFESYFGRCPALNVPGLCHEVKTLFLEDILKMTSYKEDEFKKFKSKNVCHPALNSDENSECTKQTLPPPDNSVYNIPAKTQENLDTLLKTAWETGTTEDFEDLMSLYTNEAIDINYCHSLTGVTALIAAVGRNQVFFVETFLQLGADVTYKLPYNGWDSLQWASYFKFDEISDLLKAYLTPQSVEKVENIKLQQTMKEEDKNLLDFYHGTFNDEDVDIELILCLLHHIVLCDEEPRGAVLIFLPGYEEIVKIREKIIADHVRFDSKSYVLYTLHSQMNSNDQKRVFKRVQPGVRKIILSTNLAETSITIDDVVYVVDSGKMKEKSFDSILGVSSLKSVWVSQANAIQRRGRAGRCQPGFCFHLFSSYRFQSMQKFQMPEILRIPIHEVCLQIKLLAPGIAIADFLSKLPDPPAPLCVKNSIAVLRVSFNA